MIVPYNSKKHRIDALIFVSKIKNRDFYITINNERLMIDDENIFNKFIKQSKLVYVYETPKGIDGIISVWLSNGGGLKRDYVKLNAINVDRANNLLDILTSIYFKELFVKIYKQSDYLPLYKNRQFKFFGDRGKEILLKRDKRP